ncbi:MAG TPA: prepilin-type N-terminal cleavage/methylation domain-containing protein [Gemmatimonadales bacterium]|nr:prepilin-type N-terminal cleavage/methylation domain-containing protein [Gemmatimonadales bacterium]
MQNTKTDTAGFTFVELLIVVVTMGLIAAAVAPSFARGYAGAARRSANREVTATLFRTRAIAIQRSRAARVVRTGNALQVWVADTSGTLVMVGGSRDFGTLYGVTVAATPGDTLQFDPRGFAITGSQTPRITLTNGSSVDTVCVLGLGRIASRGC